MKGSPYFLDINFLFDSHAEIECLLNMLTKKMRKKGIVIELKGIVSKIAGSEQKCFENSSLDKCSFNRPQYLKFHSRNYRLYICDIENQKVRSIATTVIGGIPRIEFDYEDLKSNDQIAELLYPSSIGWDRQMNMYICCATCIIMMDSQSGTPSLIAGKPFTKGFSDGKNGEAEFYGLSGMYCQDEPSNPNISLFVCDQIVHSIRMVTISREKPSFGLLDTIQKYTLNTHIGGLLFGNKVTDVERLQMSVRGATSTIVGHRGWDGDKDGDLKSCEFNRPCDIVKDLLRDVFYVSDSYNNKIRIIDIKKGMVSTLIGGKDDFSVMKSPTQICLIHQSLFVACYGNLDSIVRVDIGSKQMTKIVFKKGSLIKKDFNSIHGLAFNEIDNCFYLSDEFAIYRLE